MRAQFLTIPLALILAACSQHAGTRKSSDNASENDITRQALNLAENYVRSQLKGGQRMVANGIITLSDRQNMFVIEPGQIFQGPLDDDSEEDVIVSVAAFRGQSQAVTRHLILMNANGKLVLKQVVESDMEILFIKNGVITADVPTHPRTSPLFNCSECRDVVNYRLQGGELVKIE